MNNPLLFVALAGFFLTSYLHAQTPSKPAKSSLQVRKGQYVRDVAQEIYGHHDYEGVMAVYNHLDSERATFARSQVIQLPPVKEMFLEAKMDPLYMELVNEMIVVGTDYLPLAREYIQLAGQHGIDQLQVEGQRGSIKVPVSEEAKAKVAALEKRLDAAQKKFVSRLKKGHVAPKSLLINLDGTRSYVKTVASGVVDENCYAVDMVNQRLGHAFTNALIWTNENYQ